MMRTHLALIILFLALAPVPAFANVSLTIPNLPAGRTANVRFQVSVNSDLPPQTSELENQATISGDNFTSISSNLIQRRLIDNRTLVGPGYLFWNSFIDIQNIASTFDTGGTAQTVTASLLDSDGNELGQHFLTIPAYGEVDLPINLMDGFVLNSVGLLRMEFPTNRIGGNLFRYRFGPGSTGVEDEDALEFMTGENLLAGIQGDSYSVFNTIQPSLNPADTNNQVIQFLNIANLDTTNEKTFDISFYDQTGAIIRSEQIVIPPEGRRDIQSGHENPGAGVVGVIKIDPQDDSAKYIAVNSIYGANAPAGVIPESYSWAQNLRAITSSNTTQHAPISSGGKSENFIVVANSTASNGSYQLDFLENNGTNLGSTVLQIPAYGQVHISASALLPQGASGVVRITPLSSSEFIAYSNGYYRDSESQRITAAYATLARQIDKTEVFSNFNQFLRLFTWIKLFNTGSGDEVTTLSLLQSDGNASLSQGITLSANRGVDQGVHELPIAPQQNSFGLLQIENPSVKNVLREILRTQFSSDFKTITAAESLPAAR